MLSKHPKTPVDFFLGGSWLEKVTTASGFQGGIQIQVQPLQLWENYLRLQKSSDQIQAPNLHQGRIFHQKIRLENSTKNHPLFSSAFCWPSPTCLKYFYKKYVDGHKSLRKIGPPATSLLNSQVLFSQGLDLIFTQLRPEKRELRFLRWLPPATSLGGSSTRGKFTCLQRHPVTLIGGKSWKCFAFWVNLDRWKSPFPFWLLVAHWFSQWTNGPIGPAEYSRWWTGYLSNQSCVTTDSRTAPGKWFLWWGVDWAMKDQATSPFGHRKSILVEAKQALKKCMQSDIFKQAKFHG